MFDVSEGLREQTINIIDDLVNEIAPGYLRPNPFSHFDYKEPIYERVYKFVWDELAERRFENVYYRDEIFDLLRNISSERFFNAIEYLLKEMYRIVHIQITIPDDIIPNPHAGNKPWSRKESVRNRHISRYKGAVDLLNHRLFQNNAKHRYDLSNGYVQMIILDTESDVSEKNNGIQEPNDNKTPEHHQNQGDSNTQEPCDNRNAEQHQKRSRSEFWSRISYGIAVVGVIIALLGLIFGDGILRQPLHKPESESAGSTVSRTTNDKQKKDGGIQKPDDNQNTEQHQNQSRSEFWYQRNYRVTVMGVIIAFVGVIIAVLIFLFGDGILRRT